MAMVSCLSVVGTLIKLITHVNFIIMYMYIWNLSIPHTWNFSKQTGLVYMLIHCGLKIFKNKLS